MPWLVFVSGQFTTASAPGDPFRRQIPFFLKVLRAFAATCAGT
jgi:hypothetical protein